MISLKKRNDGFTVIELVIVALVILGLGLLVLKSFGDVRGRGNDLERRSDIDLTAQQLEFYYDAGETSTYPTLVNLQDSNWVKDHLKGLKADALKDPKGRMIGSSGSDYKYEPQGCGDNGCTSFSLSANLERSTPDPYVVKSINQ